MRKWYRKYVKQKLNTGVFRPLLFLFVLAVASSTVYGQDVFTSNGAGTDYNVAANWTVNRDDNNPGTSTYPGQFAGSADGNDQFIVATGHTITIDSVIFNSLDSFAVNGTGILNIGTNTIDVNNEVTGTGTVNISTGTLNAGGTVDVTTLAASGAATIEIGGDWGVTNFTHSSSVVLFDGNGAQAIRSGSDSAFHTLTVGKTADTLKVNTGILITDDGDNETGVLQIDSGIIDMNGANLTSYTVNIDSLGTLIARDGSHDIFDKLTINGTLTANSSIIAFAPFSVNVVFEIGPNGTFNAGTSTVQFNAPAGVTADLTANIRTDMSFYNLEHAPSSGAASRRGFEMTRVSAPDKTVTITNQLTRGARSNGFTTTGIDIVYANATTLRYTANNATMIIEDEWPTTGGGAVQPDNVTNLSDVALTLSSSKFIPLDGTLSLQQSAGNFQVTSGLLTINGKLQRQTTGTTGLDVSGSGALAYGPSSTLEYSPSTNVDVTVGDELTGPSLAPGNLIVNHDGDNVILPDSNIHVNGTLFMTAGTLQHIAGDTVFVSGNLTAAISGGAIYTNGVISINGTIKQTISGSSTLQELHIDKSTANDTVEVLASAVIISTFVVVEDGVLLVGDNASLTSGDSILVRDGATLAISTQPSAVANPGVLTLYGTARYVTGGKDIDADSLSLSPTSTIEFNGTGTQETTPDTNFAFGNIEISNTNGLKIRNGRTQTVRGTISWNTNGTIQTGAANSAGTLIVEGSVVGPTSSRYIDGPLRINVNGTTDQVVFPVGTTTAYRPAYFQYTNTPTDNVIEVEYFQAAPGGNEPAGVSALDNNGYYTVELISGAQPAGTYSLTLTTTDLTISPISRTKIVVQSDALGNDPSYILPAAAAVVANDTVRVTGLATFPTDDMQVAFGAGGLTLVWDGGAGNSTWSNATNWNPDAIPTSVDDVTIDLATTVRIQGATSAAANTLTIGNGALASVLVVKTSSGNPLTITETTGTPLIVMNNATLVDSNNTGDIKFGDTGGTYDTSRTDFQTGSTVRFRRGTVNVDRYWHLFVNGASSTTGDSVIIVNGDFTKNSATAFVTSNEIYVNGTYTNTLGNASFNAGLTVVGNVTLTAGLVGGTDTIHLKSTSVTANGGSFVGASNSTVNFSGSAAQTIAAGAVDTVAFRNLIISNSNGLTLNDRIQISGALSLNSGNIVSTAVNYVKFTSSGTTSSGSASSFIDGPARKVITDGSIFTFPLGDGGLWRRMEIDPNSGTATWTAEFVNADPATVGTTVNGALNLVSSNYYWNLRRSSAAIDTRVRLHWENNVDPDGIALGFLSNLRVSGFDGAEWISHGNADTTSGVAGDIQSDLIGTGFALRQFTFGSTTGDHSLPVELAAFEAVENSDMGVVNLNWRTESEIDNAYFIVQRKLGESGEFETLSNVKGQGTKTSATDYSFTDGDVVAGQTYAYRLADVSMAGRIAYHSEVEVIMTVPDKFELLQNYPNPFNPTTTITYKLPARSDVSIVVYNMLGQKIKDLVSNESFDPGVHRIVWDGRSDFGSSVSTGVYFYRIKAGKYIKARKMLFIK